ncbi:4Fe-4S binding protein [Thermosulfurimonas sp. F29]|uniref:4Fe-4S binding protein n=1 Tax=Thermosulfurimonas sp. F29 TaxID=2867247 RepID=UPI001C838836|nr:4Fe-4S binding protein [Thermosulfurimonas sp. F29]MBX6422622.1 4Fe-4S binding protein [Thermosulfurimonas sp. F29]
MQWTPGAEALLKRVPFFVRKRVRKEVEAWISAQGKDLVTEEDFLRARETLRGKAAEAREGWSVEACFGGSGCENALTDSRDLLNKVEEILREADLTSFLRERVGGPLKHHHQFRVAFSECPNACSRIHIADFAVHGRILLEIEPGLCSFCESCLEVCEEEAVRLTEAGPLVDEERCVACGACTRICPTGALREAQRGYRVLVGGKLGRRPRLATELVPFTDAEGVLRALKSVLALYRAENRRGERLGAIIERMGWEEFRKRALLEK